MTLPTLCLYVLAALPVIEARFVQLGIVAGIARGYVVKEGKPVVTLKIDSRDGLKVARDMLQSAHFYARFDYHGGVVVDGFYGATPSPPETLRVGESNGVVERVSLLGYRTADGAVRDLDEVTAKPSAPVAVLPAACLRGPVQTFGRTFSETWRAGAESERRLRLLQSAGVNPSARRYVSDQFSGASVKVMEIRYTTPFAPPAFEAESTRKAA